MSRIFECCQDEDSDQDPRKSRQNIRGSPAVSGDVGISDVDAKNKGKAITIVNPPTKYTIGYTPVTSGEHFSNQGSTNWSKKAELKREFLSILIFKPADSKTHGNHHPEYDKVPVLATKAHQEARQ